MGIGGKIKRKITVDGMVYWWFVKEDDWQEPYVTILADDHSFHAVCNLYCPGISVLKGNTAGSGIIPVPRSISDQYITVTPGYVASLIKFVNGN